MSGEKIFGKAGEQMAVAYLIREGYTILHRNYRFGKAEIDIIAEKDEVMAVIEVKSRSSELFEAITKTLKPSQIRRLVLAADHYLQENELEHEVRFDIITVLKKEGGLQLEHIKDAYYHF